MFLKRLICCCVGCWEEQAGSTNVKYREDSTAIDRLNKQFASHDLQNQSSTGRDSNYIVALKSLIVFYGRDTSTGYNNTTFIDRERGYKVLVVVVLTMDGISYITRYVGQVVFLLSVNKFKYQNSGF